MPQVRSKVYPDLIQLDVSGGAGVPRFRGNPNVHARARAADDAIHTVIRLPSVRFAFFLAAIAYI